MSQKISQREATEQEIIDAQQWSLWESGPTDHFEYDYDQDVVFIVQQGEAVIRSQFGECVSIQPGSYVRINQGVSGKWEISSPICNRYRYL
ncbi:MAG: cupin domain-containing protein [Dehalococcoidia bacterium]|nr:cupin domain-containing protein [Dehalococcoidia bacterium]HIF89761.1 DUF861 domain-containing protein [Candidatus Thioglobus sp.]